MDHDGDIIMDDSPSYYDPPASASIPQHANQSSLAEFVLTFGKFKGERLCSVPSWYLNWLPNITDPSPHFAAALAYARSLNRGTEMEIDWVAPPISSAPDDFHQWRKLKGGEKKGPATALWIGRADAARYFYLSAEILRVMGVRTVDELEGDELKWGKGVKGKLEGGVSAASGGNGGGPPRYALFHVWHLAQVYVTAGEADAALRKYKNERLRAIV